jgi:hypothetical protein
MPNVYIDHLDDLACEERLGVVRSLTRKARVQYLQGDTIPTDYSTLWTALTQAGIPTPFSQLTSRGFEMLALVNRSVALVDKDKGWVDVILKYEHVLDGPNQILIAPPGGTIYGKLRCSTVQKPTNFYRPNGDLTQDRVQLLTSHAFPLSQPANGIVGDLDLGGLTIIQGGEINIPFPQANFHVEGVIYTDEPWAFAYPLIGTVNEGLFLGTDIRHTWMLTEIQYEILTSNPVPNIGNNINNQALYRFSFEWQYDSDTWDQTIVFNDQRTGKPPAGVLPATAAVPANTQDPITGAQYTDVGVVRLIATTFRRYRPAGFWTIPYAKEVDYQSVFAAFFEGGNTIIQP